MNSFLKGICVFSFVLLSFSAAANAQNFQGIYVGAYAGGNQGNSDAHTFPAFSSFGYFNPTSPGAIGAVGNQHLSPSGFSGGGTFGFNVQHHAFVFGGETDFGSMGLSASKTGTATYPCCPSTGFTVTQTINTDWLYTGRGRLGFAAGKALFYGTGGLAATKLKYSALFTDTFAAAHENAAFDKARKGWIGGGGVEVRMSHRWSVKGEFLHADFGQELTTSTNLTAIFGPTTVLFPQNPFTHNADLTAHIFRGGLNYRF